MFAEKKICIIAAIDKNRIIGCRGKIPWQGDMSSDMIRFRLLTKGHSVIMGRKTWDSLPRKFKPLPERQNIIITRNESFPLDHKIAVIANSFEEALSRVYSSIAWVMGGEEIYKLALPYTDEIFLTVIQDMFDGDARFPELDYHEWKADCEPEEKCAKESGDKYNSTFYHFTRLKAPL